MLIMLEPCCGCCAPKTYLLQSSGPICGSILAPSLESGEPALHQRDAMELARRTWPKEGSVASSKATEVDQRKLFLSVLIARHWKNKKLLPAVLSMGGNGTGSPAALACVRRHFGYTPQPHHQPTQLFAHCTECQWEHSSGSSTSGSLEPMCSSILRSSQL